MFWLTLLAAAAVAAVARADSHADLAPWPGAVVERAANNASTLLVAATAQAGAGVTFNADGSINATAWDATVMAACAAALARLPASSNPSGTCICYNLPALDTTTGAFEADLRLYQLSTPRDAFAGIAPGAIQVGLTYTAASVAPVAPTAALSSSSSSSTASSTTSPSSSSSSSPGKARRQALVTTTATAAAATATPSGLRLLQSYLFVGHIQQDRMTPHMSMAELEALVMPVVTLSATDAAGQHVATNVSANEAAFVAGVFSDAVVQSNATRAQAAVDAVVAGLHNGTVAFVLPGVQLLIFPVGLVVTSVWLAAGVAVIGLGMVERVRFREQFRQRTQAKPRMGGI